MTTVTTSLQEMTFEAAHDLIRLTDWHANVPAELFRRACDHSVCFGILDAPTAAWPHALVAFARVVTDHATYAYLCDVIVHPDWRGRGFARDLVDATLAHPDIGALRRYALLSRHAPDLYRKHGFADLNAAITYLEIYRPMHGR